MGAAAALCRDKDGHYLGASAVVYDGLVDAASLEVQACNAVLALAEDLNLQNFIVASDSKQTTSDICQGG